MENKLPARFRTEARLASSITFAVDDVAPATSPLPTCKPPEAIRALLEVPSQGFDGDESSQDAPTSGRVEACWNYALDCVAGIGHHPLIAAAHLAFGQHRPLVLSPDVIWVTIAQGFAQHIRLSPETYRAFLVRHKGKRELTVERDDLYPGSPENPWAEVVAEFASQVHREVGELAERFVCDFSTTGPVERTVSEVALLDVFQPYFSYSFGCICGIPSITLEGTPADWRKLREKVELLAPFGLDWWLSELRPICDQFARAAAGDIDRQHWRRLYKVRAAYGREVINGWLGKLFPYTRDFITKKFSHRNDLLDPQVEAKIRQLESEEEDTGKKEQMRLGAPGIEAKALPRGLSQVPFTLSDLMAGAKRAMEFVAGPIAVTQEDDTGALRPTLGWAVRESPPIEQAMIRLAEHRLEPARIGRSKETMPRGLNWLCGYVPADVLRFYQQAARATIQGENRAPLFRVLPLAKWARPEWAKESTRPRRETLWNLSRLFRFAETSRLPRFAEMRELFRFAETGDLFRFAETGDGTELVIQLSRRGAVFVGYQRNGKPVAETGQKVARSFTDFLLRALDSGSEVYFRRADFVPLD